MIRILSARSVRLGIDFNGLPERDGLRVRDLLSGVSRPLMGDRVEALPPQRSELVGRGAGIFEAHVERRADSPFPELDAGPIPVHP